MAAILQERRRRVNDKRNKRIRQRYDPRMSIRTALKMLEDGKLKRIFDDKDALNMCTDASNTGCGAVLLHNRRTVSYLRDEQEHINVAEIKAITAAIRAFDLNYCSVRVWCDNQVAVYALSKGFSPSLQIRLALEDLFMEITERDIGIRMKWIPTADNIVADKLSRAVTLDEEDYKITGKYVSENI